MLQHSRVPCRPVVTAGLPRMQLAGVRLGIKAAATAHPHSQLGRVRPGLELGPFNEGVLQLPPLQGKDSVR